MGENYKLTIPLVFAILVGNAAAASIGNSNEPEAPEVTNLREYLRINSAHPNPDYGPSIAWLRNKSDEIGLDFHFLQFEQPNSFALWLTWNGTNPSLKSILLNSHIDVVAVDSAKWEHDPFGAEKDEFGNIYARGAIDMKSATVGQLEAIRRLKAEGFQPLRTIHMSILPDEEMSGRLGMIPFINSTEFKELNVGFDMDESTSNPDNDTMYIPYGEKAIWQFNITVTGAAGHGSTIPTETASEKLQIVINRLMAYRQTQVDYLNEPGVTMANVTSLNLVRIGGGLGNNIIPNELWASFDMRIRVKPGWNFTDVEEFLNNIIREAGEGTTINFISKSLISAETPVGDSNIWWTELQKTCAEMNVTCIPDFLSGGTDGRHARTIGIPVFGVNPFLNTPKMAHMDDERINEFNFLEGIPRYALLIKNMASVPQDSVDEF